MDELTKARQKINDVDRKIAELFEERMIACAQIAEYKKERGLSILDKSRENEVIERNCAFVKDDVIREYYADYLRKTMEVSRAYQSRLISGARVAYSGVVGAFAHIAAMRAYPEGVYVPYPDFASAYAAVEKGECDYAVLPIENSFAGDVGNVMDLMFSGSLFVNRMLELPVEHCLLGVNGATKESVKRVFSHPQALSQCAKYVSENGLEEVEFPNTAVAAKTVAESGDTSVAAIASEETAKIYGLTVLERRINSAANNTTRFAVFSRAKSEWKAKSKMGEHFILVFTVKNEAGSLAKTLDIIGAHGYNMRTLRSRPMKELIWNYYFFIEAQGDIDSPDGKDMLIQLSATCDRLKLVGTYFQGEKE